ncbi:MAG: tripartite tricarboxylate transporter TctB family protein [Rhodobacteraceae bacterium]|nr:tripartite tricarboxylate transporter TctB family protein [Paracoccaceae bacterium]
MSDATRPKIEFEGEDANSGYASPLLDLVATVFLVLLSLGIMAASVALPIPGDLTTAPGLLPFLVSATLFLMAIGLGASALTRRRAGLQIQDMTRRDRQADLRTIFLGISVAAYIAALQVFAYQLRLSFLGFDYVLTAFEPVTILALASIIHMSWRGPIWITACISTGWAFLLSLVFQKVFNIPLPGSF